jgi:thioredoxin 1
MLYGICFLWKETDLESVINNQQLGIMADNKKFMEMIHRSEIPVLVDFYTTWCTPCKFVTPMLHEVAHEFEDKIKVIKIDVDTHQQIAIQFGISSVPTLVLFFNRSEIWRQSGVATKSAIVAQVQKILATA